MYIYNIPETICLLLAVLENTQLNLPSICATDRHEKPSH